jgi:hypothetical protein
MGEGIASYPKADTCPSRARFLNRHIKGVKVDRRLEEYIMGNKLDGEHTGTANARKRKTISKRNKRQPRRPPKDVR